jgi:hypothetical protein
MKTRVTILLALAVVGCLVAAAPASPSQATAFEELHWTRASVCEHPNYMGRFLQYYLTDGCGHELFLHGDLSLNMVGSTVWAEGEYLQNMGCHILDVDEMDVCDPPDPNVDVE